MKTSYVGSHHQILAWRPNLLTFLVATRASNEGNYPFYSSHGHYPITSQINSFPLSPTILESKDLPAMIRTARNF